MGILLRFWHRSLGFVILVAVATSAPTVTAARTTFERVRSSRTAAECPTLPLHEEFARSDAVFVGRAVSQPAVTTAIPSETETTFVVERVWKGKRDRDKRLRVRTCGGVVGDQTVTCGESFRFQLGSPYVVLAGGEPLTTDTCHHTALVDGAVETLRWLSTQEGLQFPEGALVSPRPSQDPTSAPANVLDELDRAEATWQASKIEAYEFRFHYACNGLIPPTPPQVPRGMLIRFKDGKSTYVRPGADPVPVSMELVQYSTVEKLFAFIRKAWTSGPVRMQVQYDQARGFPISVCLDPAAAVSDDEFGFLITDFRALSNAR
jgi:uncharacterized protein DUF6174